MKIKIERSGGITGIASSSEIDATTLPPSLIATVQDLLFRNETTLNEVRKPKGTADDINYRITIRNRAKNRIINCSELDMGNNIKSLVRFIEKNSLKKSKSS